MCDAFEIDGWIKTRIPSLRYGITSLNGRLQKQIPDGNDKQESSKMNV
jgi:hypothetical protein